MPLDSKNSELFCKNISSSPFAKLTRYHQLIRKWNQRINLVSNNDMNDIWSRHFEDSYQLIRYISGVENAKILLDLGSGGGFPAIIIAICIPNITVIMTESDKRKSIFLSECIRMLDLSNATVLNQRIEKLSAQNADIITARACAALPTLLDLSVLHMKKTAKAFFLKGSTVIDEISVASDYQFEYDLHSSITSSEAYVLEIRNVSRAL